jgi:hypothetical protein
MPPSILLLLEPKENIDKHNITPIQITYFFPIMNCVIPALTSVEPAEVAFYSKFGPVKEHVIIL